MPQPVILPSFAAGELSPALHGRVDLAKYQVGLATCLNWFVHPFGGASTRAGTAFVGEVYDPAARSRLVPFSFSVEQTYVLEFANLRMRVIKDGGYVLEAPGAITGVTQANPGVVTVVGHGLSNGDHVWIDGVGGMAQLNRRRFTVANVTTDTFELLGLDTTGYGAWTSGGTAARFYTLGTPYGTADLALLKFVQSADTMTITHPGYAPRNLTRTGHTSWTLTAITFAPQTAAPTGFTSSSGGGSVFYAITAVNDETGEESLPLTGNAANSSSTLTFTPVTGCSRYNVYNLRQGIFGFIGNCGTTGFTDAAIVSDPSITPPESRNPFSGSNLYPGCSTYHDGRQFYGRSNTYPQTIWASQSANFRNMSVSTPTQDNDAITRTIASREVNEIRFLLSLNVLLAFTSGAVWKGWAGAQADIITPANFNVRPQSYDGIAQIPPIATETSALYVTASGRKVRDVAYEFGSDSFAGRNLSILAGHLFEAHGLEEWAYARDPDGVVWCVRADGVLLGFTYLKEHDVYAWSRHVTDGAVESVAAVQENDQTVLYLAVKRTIGGQTRRHVERMVPRLFFSAYDAWCVDGGHRYDGWNTNTAHGLTITGATYNAGDTVTLQATGHAPFTAGSVGARYILRSGQNQVTVSVSAYGTSSTVSATLDMAPHASLHARATSDWALATSTLAGLWHLEGRTVAILADGSVQPPAAVTNGRITVPRAAGRILAGLPYVCDLETLNIESQPTLQGRRKRVTEVTLRVKDSRGLQVGPTADRLTAIKERINENYGYPTLLVTGDETLLIDPSWNANGRVFIRQANPLPATVVAIIPRLEVGE